MASTSKSPKRSQSGRSRVMSLVVNGQMEDDVLLEEQDLFLKPKPSHVLYVRGFVHICIMAVVLDALVVFFSCGDVKAGEFYNGFGHRYEVWSSSYDLAVAGFLRIFSSFYVLWVVRKLSNLHHTGVSRQKARRKHAVSTTAMLPIVVTAASNCFCLIKVICVAILGPPGLMPATFLYAMCGISVALAILHAWSGVTALSRACEHLPDVEDDDGADTDSTATLGRMMTLLKPDWPMYVIGFLFLVSAALAQIALPLLTGNAIDSVAFNNVSHQNCSSDELLVAILSQHNNAEFHKNILLLTLISVAAGIFSGCRGSFFLWGEARMSIRLNNDLFESIVFRDLYFFDKTETGEITSRLTSDTTKIIDGLTLNINVFLRSIVQSIGVIIFMATLNWKLTLVTFVSIPIVTVLSHYYGLYYQKLSKNVQQTFAKANDVAEQSISNIKTVRSFANERGEVDKYSAKLQETYLTKLKQARAYAAYMALTTMLPLLVQALVLWYGGKLILSGEITGGTLVAFAFYQMSLSNAINSIGWVFSGLMEALGAAEKVFEYLDEVDELQLLKADQSDNSDIQLDQGACSIEFNNVSFAYPTRVEAQVLDNISFTINPGEYVALVGESGGGKSTCMELLQRFYKIQEGSITLDGIDIREISHQTLHKSVCMVSQEPTLFSDSFSDNIMYGTKGKTLDDVTKATIAASCHDFITSMPDGFNTVVGERGTLLSGGQKQRVAIARALVRSPRVLLLDEATSALDSESEQLVQNSIQALRSRCTIVTIAHRLSTVRHADRIIVIDGGRVCEQGTHVALMAIEDGKYKNLVQRQLGTKEAEVETELEKTST